MFMPLFKGFDPSFMSGLVTKSMAASDHAVYLWPWSKTCYMGGSSNEGTPKWTIKMDDLEVPRFQETTIWRYMEIDGLWSSHNQGFLTLASHWKPCWLIGNPPPNVGPWKIHICSPSNHQWYPNKLLPLSPYFIATFFDAFSPWHILWTGVWK